MHQKCFLAARKPKALELSNFTFLHLYHAAFYQIIKLPVTKKAQQIYLVYLPIVFYLNLNKQNQ